MQPPVVLVDARNVLRSRWPNIGEQELVERCRAWGIRQDCSVVVVFDGAAPAHPSDDRVTVVGSGAETADDWLVRAAAERHARGERLWLVTSDRALREAARGLVERTIGGGGFAAELGR